MNNRLFRFVCLAACFCLLPMFSQAQEDVDVSDADSLEQYVEFMVPDYGYIETVINDKNSSFYYPKLLKRFAAADTTLTLEHVHCLYYGYALQEDYNPYLRLDEEEEAMGLLNHEEVSKKDAKKAIKLLNKAVEKAPTHLRLYMLRFIANKLAYGDDAKQARDDAFRYIALVSAIAVSGNGTDFNNAFHVVIVNHSYSLMDYYGFSATSQALQYKDGHSYDVFELQENEYGVEELYFNVDRCLGYLSGMFSSDDYADSNFEEPLPDDNIVIPLGRKVVLRLEAMNSDGVYDFTVVSSEPFDEVVDMDDKENYFTEQGEENTIVLYFCRGRWASGKDCIFLMEKSFCPDMLNYDTELLYPGQSAFSATSNSGMFPKVLGLEIWNDAIVSIKISNIRDAK